MSHYADFFTGKLLLVFVSFTSNSLWLIFFKVFGTGMVNKGDRWVMALAFTATSNKIREKFDVTTECG